MFLGEKSKKEKVKIKTQNEKILETDMDIWYYTYKKTVISVRKKERDVSIICKFAFKGPKYARNIVFLRFSCRFLKILKKRSGCFSHTEYL